MNPKMMVGPLLGVENDSVYTVCFLSDRTVDGCDLFVNDARMASFRKIADTYSGQFWRAEFPVAANGSSQSWTYEIQSNGTRFQGASGASRWTFYVPGSSAPDRLCLVQRLLVGEADQKNRGAVLPLEADVPTARDGATVFVDHGRGSVVCGRDLGEFPGADDRQMERAVAVEQNFLQSRGENFEGSEPLL